MNEEEKIRLKKYDRFLADSMHTLKNMIAPINAYVEMLQSGLVDEGQKRDINDKIEFCAKSATQLCTNLMDIFRVRGELTDFRAEKVNPYHIFQEYFMMIESNLKPKQITVKNQLDPTVFLSCNANMLTSLFMNLITNAIKFSSENSTIVVSGERVEQGRFAIRIKDEGVGIDEAKIEEKLRNNTDYCTTGTMNESGTGLGLLLVKAILEKNDGSLKAYNNKDKGATFEFTLPLYKEN
ncbi:MAG: HAMP domain-containing histidine kinase [Bacteroidales bacterium]|nr:HAMP domain-containing histidine kinase [Bacteroidales bacterium]